MRGKKIKMGCAASGKKISWRRQGEGQKYERVGKRRDERGGT